ncbi:hypothetical protein [Proteus sp. STS61-E]
MAQTLVENSERVSIRITTEDKSLHLINSCIATQDRIMKMVVLKLI